MLDTANIARKEELKNVMVSNGFINEKPLKELCKYLDGINIDLKGFTNFFYGKTTTAWIQPVLDSLKILRKEDVLLEITNLIIPSLNDDLKEVEKMCSWIKKNLGIDVPLHFSAFHPDFELRNLPSTPLSTLMNAYDIAKTTGLRYVYIGNVITKNYENTYCPDCKTLIIERMGFNVLQNHILRGKCEFCDCKIEGVFH
jgi:pyruvate formate lyase activating enzyme